MTEMHAYPIYLWGEGGRVGWLHVEQAVVDRVLIQSVVPGINAEGDTENYYLIPQQPPAENESVPPVLTVVKP